MEILKTEHANIRILASRELQQFGIKRKLIKLPSKASGVTKKRCFGVAISHLQTVDVHIGDAMVPVPKVFNDLVNFIRDDMWEEGIFRVAGTKPKERTLVRILDNGYQIPEGTTIIEACSVTKIMLRHIPDRLVPKDFTPWFLEAGKLDGHSGVALGLCVLLLPLKNLYLLVFLMQFFNEVAAHESHNKMTSHNLAVVLSPNIFANANAKVSLQSQREFTMSTLNITRILIEEAKTLGTVPPGLLNQLEELHEENMTKKKFCAWYVLFQEQFRNSCLHLFVQRIVKK